MNLQDVADELADNLGRDVVIDGLDARPVAASSIRALSATGISRLAIPIRDDRGHLGTLWFADADAPLTSSQYSIVDVAANAVRSLLGRERVDSRDMTRSAVTARLLADDLGTRREAFAYAAMKYWIFTSPGTAVLAARIHAGTRHLEQVALARHLDRRKDIDLTFLAERDGVLFFLFHHDSPGTRQDAVAAAGEVVRRTAASAGLVVDGVGAAHFDPGDDDLAYTAEQARRAAEIVTWLPHLKGAADISQLGTWVLLDSIGTGSQIALFSPAALRLWNEKNPLQLETVEIYLDQCGRAREACELLHIHRTTLYYRLDNLPVEVKDALSTGVTRSALHICLKLLRYWEATGRL